MYLFIYLFIYLLIYLFIYLFIILAANNMDLYNGFLHRNAGKAKYQGTRYAYVSLNFDVMLRPLKVKNQSIPIRLGQVVHISEQNRYRKLS